MALTGTEDPRLADPGLAALLADPAALSYWQAATGGQAAGDAALEYQLARDILSVRGDHPPAAVLAARGPMLSRASAALRVAAPHPDAGPGDGRVDLHRLEVPWRGFFELDVLHVAHRLFGGGMSPALRREVFVMTDAATVLPYDPRTDLVLLVEQFRAGAQMRGAARPWQLEAVAGRIDGGETPESTARREAVEEAGIEIGDLLKVADFYPSPGATTEYIHAFVGLTRLAAPGTALHGLQSEGEDIRTHILPFAAAMDWLAEGRIENAPLVLSLLWLQRERPELRQAAGAA